MFETSEVFVVRVSRRNSLDEALKCGCLSHATIVDSLGPSFSAALMYTCMLIYVVGLIASAKSWSAREAFHQPDFMDGCMTISHICLSFLSSGRTLFLRDLLVAGRVER